MIVRMILTVGNNIFDAQDYWAENGNCRNKQPFLVLCRLRSRCGVGLDPVIPVFHATVSGGSEEAQRCEAYAL